MKKASARLARFLDEDFKHYLKARGKKNVVAQALEVLELFWEYRFPPYQYFKHDLYLKSFKGEVKKFMPPELIHRFRDSVNPSEYHRWAIDKSAFFRKMCEARIPVVPTIAEIRRDGSVVGSLGEPVSFADVLAKCAGDGHRRLFFKPNSGGAGSGVFRAVTDGAAVVVADQRLSFEELIRRMFGQGRFLSYLVQPYIQQHSVLDAICPNSVNTVRIDTFVSGDDVMHDAAALRIGSGKSEADNWALGGFVCGIDLGAGTLADYAVSKARYGRRKVARHPETNFVFEGATLPFWSEIKLMVAAGARALLPLRSLGWDVAITPDGPLVIEVNHDFDVFLLQEAIQGLRDTPLGRAARGLPAVNCSACARENPAENAS